MSHAIVGCGRIAICHAAAFAESGALSACVDIVPEAAQQFAERFGVRTATFEEVLDDPSIVSISLCTPHDTHGRLAELAVRHGKHVLIEKPLVLDLTEGERLAALAREHGVVVMPVVQHRFDPIVQAVADLVRSGDLGDVRLVRAHLECARPAEYYRDSPWRGKWASEGGSVVMNQAYHMTDLLLYLCGAADHVSAEMATFAPKEVMETEDTVVATLRFRSGAMGSLTVTGAAGATWNSYIELLGTNGEVAFTINYPQSVGRFRVNDKRSMLQWKKRFADASVPSTQQAPAGAEYYGVSHFDQVRAFLAAIAGTTSERAATVDEAFATIGFIQRLYSAARGETVKPRAAAPSVPAPWDDAWVDVTGEDADKVAALMRSGQISIVSGGALEIFERQFARFAGHAYGVAFSSGTMAIYTALRAVGVGAGDDVLVCDYSFHAVGAAIFALGARIIPCDCLPESLTLDPDEIARKRTPRTKAILVHCPWGVPPEAERIRAAAEGIPVVYDASHAHGAMFSGKPLASFADIAAFSLGRQKLISGGELGAAVTSDVTLRDRMLTYAHVNRVPAALRGSEWRGNAVGLKGRPHPAALSLAISQLGRIEQKLRLSRESCRRIEEILAPHGFLKMVPPDGSVRSYWRIVLRLGPQWDGVPVSEVEAMLREAGLPVEENHYWPLLQEQDVARWPEHESLIVRTETPVAHALVPRTITLAAPVAASEDALAKLRAYATSRIGLATNPMF